MQWIASELIEISWKAGRVSHCKAQYFKSLFSWRILEMISEYLLLSHYVILHVTCLGGFTFVCLKNSKNRKHRIFFFFSSAFSSNSFKIHFALDATLHLLMLNSPTLFWVQLTCLLWLCKIKINGKARINQIAQSDCRITCARGRIHRWDDCFPNCSF